MTSIKYKFGLLFGILLFSLNFAASQWVDYPITCYTCEGEDCADSRGVYKVCEGNDRQSQTCVTVFSDSTVISRGCRKTVEAKHEEFCESNSDKCLSCYSNGCNRGFTLSEYVECLSCDSENDRNCVLNPSAVTSTRLCYKACMVALYARNASDSNSVYELSRTCLDDKDLDSRDECSQGADESCKACEGEKCNTATLPENRHSCYHCKSENDDCQDEINYDCVSYTPSDQCYFLFDEYKDIVRMGCRSEFDTEAVVAQISDQKLVLCDGADCNNFSNFPLPIKCNKCDSKVDPNCLDNPTSLELDTTCSSPYPQCYSKVSDTNAGATVRGCLNELSGAEFYECLMNGDKTCQSCSGVHCNEEVVPSDRIQCQRCNSENDSNCHISPSAQSLCPLYSKDETCVSVYKNGVTTRGCGSELTCNPNNTKSCKICSSAGCNTANVKRSSEESYGIFQELPLSCYTCNGDECAQSTGEVKLCEGNAQQDCLTVFNSAGQVISRGCEDSLATSFSSICTANPELCFNCKSNKCNTISEASDYVDCIYCDTANDPDCVQELTKIVTSRKCTKGCVTALYPRSDDPSVKELIRACVDDIEAEDVDACGSDSNCVKCQGQNCNTIALPEVRLSCNFCEGDDCELISAKECPTYAESDQCFTLFDESTTVVRMGCKSELTANEVREHIKLLLTCDGENCNSYENFPRDNVCAVCNSSSDVACATNPEGTLALTQCTALPNKQCYSRVAADGTTARGCLQTLPVDDFMECLDGTSCKICTGTSCNQELFPADRAICHRCNSLNSDQCESTPSAASACPLYVEGDSCVTKVVNGITTRGCGSEISCGTLGRRNCRECSGASCNKIDLVSEDVGVPGLWQGVPINCYTCNGEACATSNGLLMVCNGNNQQTCATVFSEEGNVIARGCSDSVDASYANDCDANPDLCFQCKSSGCNTAVSTSDYIDCIFCDGKTNPNCTVNVADVSRTRKCHKACMTALYPRTSDANPSYDLTRTCLDDKDLDDRESCDTDPWCKSCSGDSCNTALMPDVRQTCFQCSGDGCQAPTARPCRSFTSDEQCFALYDETNSFIELGCKSDYDPQDINALLLLRKLYLCNGDNCNDIAELPQSNSCHICSSRTDSLCATNPTGLLSNSTCRRLPITNCYTRVLDDGHTERGCLSSLEDDDFLDCYNGESIKCTTCASGFCNQEIYPEDRLSCHICNSNLDPSCEGKPQQSSVCVKYSPEQTCIATVKDGITHRGCSEQLSCDGVCQNCNTSDCNANNLVRKLDANPGVWQELPLNCYHCSGDQCTSSLGQLNVCTNNSAQHCMTVFGEAGTVIRRGCSEAVEEQYGSYCDASSENCFNCNSNGCNNAFSLDNFVDCIYCDSSVDKYCVLNLSEVRKSRRCHKQCMVALRPRSASQTNVYELVRSCLDDKDLDDRDLCGSDGSNCISCASDNCNIDDLVENRLQCLSCVGDACEDPQSQICVSEEESRSCFILFDADNTVSRMGCLSEFTDVELTTNLPKLITCTGDNCNDFSIIPQAQTCAVCDSSSDIRCAIDPTANPTVKTCSNLPRVDCYSRIKTDGRTARGCLSDLTRQLQLDCLTGNANCSLCLGNGCNSQIFPEDRLTCHKCNSLEDSNCQDAPSSPYVCPIYSPNEICSSKIVYDVTYRGCGDDFTCDDTDKQKCKLCNSSNCNRANLYQNQIGYPGTWQDPPISCLTCLGDDCGNEATTVLKKCANNLQNCVTVFSMTGAVVQRGCSDEVYSGFYDHHCDNHADLCKYCKSSGCNDADSLDDYVDCLFCDSQTNANCAVVPSSIAKSRKCQKCMTALYPRNNDTNPSYVLSRSCADDKEADDRLECESGNDSKCKICQDDKCNTALIPNERLSCYHCQGEDCEDPAEAVCPIYKENDRCYLLFGNANDNTVIQMGCASEFSESGLAAIRKKMILCDGDLCNTFDKIPLARQCLVCDSEDDPLCATQPNDLLNFVPCTDFPHTRCYTKIDNGFTKRGCLSENTIEAIDICLEQGDGAKCNVCDGERCNIAVYPADRRTCHRCSSSDDSNCQGSPRDPSVCPIYKEDDECVVHLSDETTSRGCKTDFGCDTSDRDTCRICPNNNCNTIDLLSAYVGKPGLWQDLPLACYECTGADCQNALSAPKSCENNYLQNCVTVFDAGVVVRRGCSDDVNEDYGEWCDANSGSCQLCKSSGCNSGQSLDEYVDCVFCDSSTNPNCVLSPADGIRTRKCRQNCMVALYPKNTEDDPSYELSRSCLDDKEAEDRDSCAAGDSKCQSCNAGSCNNFAFPADRHQCWTCSGNDCEDAKVQDCVSYHPEDQCYILFDNSSSIVSMGCRSEMPHAAVANLVQSKSLILCNGRNCNSYESIPQAQSCVVCHSATDPRCATNPNLIPNAQTCSLIPYTGCFTRINENGETERGCQADLVNDKFYQCLTASDPKCGTCAGDNCNADVYPANRLRCHRCNSTADASCATSPASNMVCPILLDGESCVASYRDGLTERGCSYELGCDASNKKLCRVCTSAGCNSQNLEHVAKDGEPGKWQDVPISCYTCEGAACSSLGSVETCEHNNLQNCMTVFDANGVVIQRGCSDPVTEAKESWCEQNLDKCYRCNSNECNKAQSLSDYVECVTCDSTIDGSCVRDPLSQRIARKCYQSCMTALYPQTSEEDPSYATTRTCLDDKESEDRDICTSGSDNLCSACTTDNCNVDELPTDRRSCYHCSGDGCQVAQEKTCAGYRPNDQCFIKFDETLSVVEMGCKSDLTNAQSISLIKAKRLFLCDDDNCNSFDKIPDTQTCALCNSRTDASCAIDPVGIITNTTCRRLPYTHCYSRVLSDGATERGCLSSLDSEEFYDCLTEESGSCKPCLGSGCNRNPFPENRRECHICDSGDDSECESSPDSIGICPLYDPDDTCVTSYVAGRTTRGCGTTTVCDSSSRRSCRVCSSNGCNTIDLASLWDDNFGRWQDLPLSCYECEGAGCQSGPGDLITCAINNEQDCSTVFNSNGVVVRRGCSDQIDSEFGDTCDENPGLCFNCKSNECNTAVATTEFTQCHYCDSNKDKNCVTNPLNSTFKSRHCQGSCMVALYESTSGSNPTYDMMRTCLNDKEVADQNSCAAGNEAFCKACTGDRCNVNDLPSNRLRCYTCFGDDCEIPTSSLCPIYKENDQCFVRFDETNSISEMGCLSEFRSQSIEDILKSKRVYICNGENCNNLNNPPTPKKCAVCDSTVDLNCAINPILIGTIESCYLMPYTDCYTKISSSGTTHRGCLTDLESNDFVKCILSGGEDCSLCANDGCNRQVFPESRLRCHSCSSESDPECESLPTSLEICPLVKANEKCVTAIDSNSTVRGCSSQLLCDANDRSTCRRCDAHGCNTVDLVNRFDDKNHGMWQELPLRCHNCVGDYCLNSLGPSQTCTGGDDQDCVTVFNETGVVIRRGCLYDVEDDHDLYCRANPDNCLVCKSNECNDAWDLSDFFDCIACDSATDATCATNPTKSVLPTRKCQRGCMVASYTAANDTKQIIRTCLDDKELQAQHICRLDEPGITCASCTNDNCNNFNYPRDRLSCHVCEGIDCSQLSTEHCAAYIEGDTCFAKYENGIIDIAGCSSAVDDSVMEGWKEQNKIFSCETDICNDPSKLPASQNCVSCDSSKGKECATDPTAVTTLAHCTAPVNSCFSNVTNGVTHRGCLQSLNLAQQTSCNANNATLCESCVGEKCNSEIYPSDRRRCHICTSDSDEKCKNDPGAVPVSICPTYQANNLCVVKLGNSLLERGCSSDLSCDVSDSNHCRVCSTDGCNVDLLDDGAHTLIANKYLLTLLVAIISLIGLNSN